MPAWPRIAGLVAAPALAAPPAALAQSGGGGGARDSQYQDPFGSAQVRDSGAQTLPRTGFDLLPVAAIGMVLLLGGLAPWRRAHAAKGR